MDIDYDIDLEAAQMANVRVVAPTTDPAGQSEALAGSLGDAGNKGLDHCMFIGPPMTACLCTRHANRRLLVRFSQSAKMETSSAAIASSSCAMGDATSSSDTESMSF